VEDEMYLTDADVFDKIIRCTECTEIVVNLISKPEKQEKMREAV
jgi:hypothetical protein